ncbi:MAG: hypothetical protein JRL30_10405 [Deltaproteobacteria bacterium]|nr:hypothetical protein [Deltaproteobacteria bacterium]
MNSNSTDVRQIRRFGIIALVFFGCLCVLGFWADKPIPTYIFGFLCVLGAGFVCIPRQLAPVYRLWLNIAHAIGRIFTVIILILAYYLVITPSGLIKRLFGGRPIPLKPDRNASSYWVARDEPAQPTERFLKRY